MDPTPSKTPTGPAQPVRANDGRPGRRTRPLLRRGLLTALGVAVALLAAEGAASLVLSWRSAIDLRYRYERQHCRFDPELGWSHKPGFRGRDLYGPAQHLTIGARGMRATREYAERVPDGRRRVICLGDSFTLGYGVDDSATWPARLEVHGRDLEAVNMGQAAYGLDQSYLWYLRDGVALETDLLLVALIGEDLERMVPEGALTQRGKPFLELDGERLEVRPPEPADWERGTRVPSLQRLGSRMALGRLRSAWRDSADPASRAGSRAGSLSAPPLSGPPLSAPPPSGRADPPGRRKAEPRSGSPSAGRRSVGQRAFAPLARRVFRELAELSAERGQRMAVCYLPTLADLNGVAPDYPGWLAATLAELGVPFFDLSDDLRRPGRDQLALFGADRHYSRRGNDAVARALLERLPEFGPETTAPARDLSRAGAEEEPEVAAPESVDASGSGQ